jgi:hypothetical protein
VKGLLLLSLMFLIGGGATLLVGRRAAALGVQRWLGMVITVSGALVALAGIAGITISVLL